MNNSFYGRYKGEVNLLIVTLLWSATFVIVKGSLEDISSMLFIGLRFLIAGLILLPIVIRQKLDWKNSKLLPPIFLGVLLFLGFATQTVGLKHTSATKSAFLTGSAVAIIPFLQLIIEKKKPKTGPLIGVAVVLIGILFLSGGNSIVTLLTDIVTNFNFGDFLTLICAVFFALYVVYLDMLSAKYIFWMLLIIQIGVSAILSFSTAIIFDFINYESLRVELTTQLSFGIIYTSIFATLFTTTLQTKYQKLVSPTKAGIVYSFEPIFAAIIAFVFLSERISPFGLLGAILIFVGLIISETYDGIFKSLRKSD
ncbi:MAG: DMT family transporter [Bacteroidetes bacterium]|nr:DMT family transporter [Bacteroidota bacterium]MBU1113682.1 DMT family transporter [Bacteroidota bacterium]MBU1799099.1 DMT family transporter [Bacteroidota bacterium]